MNIKSFITLGRGVIALKILQPQFTNICHKLERFTLASLFSLGPMLYKNFLRNLRIFVIS
jgi:hypothetical protein